MTLVILVESSDHGCRFCRAKSDELCTHRGSAGSGCARLFWKASCCSCRRMRFACCLSASRSSAVCRLPREQAVIQCEHQPGSDACADSPGGAEGRLHFGPRQRTGKTWETSLSPPTPSMDVGMARSNGEVCEAPNSWHSPTRSTQRTTTTPG